MQTAILLHDVGKTSDPVSRELAPVNMSDCNSSWSKSRVVHDDIGLSKKKKKKHQGSTEEESGAQEKVGAVPILQPIKGECIRFSKISAQPGKEDGRRWGTIRPTFLLEGGKIHALQVMLQLMEFLLGWAHLAGLVFGHGLRPRLMCTLRGRINLDGRGDHKVAIRAKSQNVGKMAQTAAVACRWFFLSLEEQN
jgi:hypothetical protein